LNRTIKLLSPALAVVALAAVALAQDVGQGGGSPFCNTGVNVAIPDNVPAGATNDLVIPDSFVLTDLDMTIQATHSWVGDITVTLAKTAGPGAPLGPITVMARPGNPASAFGCSGNDINTTLSDGSADVENQCAGAPPAIGAGPFGPSPGALNGTFAGVDINGTWQITVSDAAGGDTGTLVTWCLATTPVPVELMEFEVE
jgi:subtilisin-like proprotein convertase family protein